MVKSALVYGLRVGAFGVRERLYRAFNHGHLRFYPSAFSHPTDLKRLYRQTGVQCQSTLFLFSDTHVAEEAFLEDINNMLSSGEVPNLFKADEFEEVSNAIIDQAKKEGVDESPQVSTTKTVS